MPLTLSNYNSTLLRVRFLSETAVNRGAVRVLRAIPYRERVTTLVPRKSDLSDIFPLRPAKVRNRNFKALELDTAMGKFFETIKGQEFTAYDAVDFLRELGFGEKKNQINLYLNTLIGSRLTYTGYEGRRRVFKLN
jgi:hypothetical protein